MSSDTYNGRDLKHEAIMSVLVEVDKPLSARGVQRRLDRFGRHATKTGLDELAEKGKIVKEDCHCGQSKVYHA